MSFLCIDNVTVFYPQGISPYKPVLENLSLQIKKDDLVVVLGPSGCGKTTLINLVAGFVKPDSGQIKLNSNLLQGPGADRGIIFQENALFPWLKVIDNIAFGLQLQGLPRPDRLQTAEQFLKLVGLRGYGQHRIWELSGGMKQRVSLARALASNPSLLLMDEPFGALDALAREQMQELLLQVWHKTHKQILLITHDIEEAVFLAGELVLMASYPGKIVDKIPLDFSKRFIAGEPTRQIKSDPAFIKTREYVLTWLFEQQASNHLEASL
jgi:taurine transport system ATP-binding protein